MIRCTLRDLEERCHQRGYTLDDVRGCIAGVDGDFIVVDETHKDYPRARPGLGDMIKAGLSAIGITEKRVSAAIGRPCGCSQRAEALNELGRKIGIG